MIIKKETLDALELQGIRLRPYICSDEEYRQNRYNYWYKGCYGHSYYDYEKHCDYIVSHEKADEEANEYADRMMDCEKYGNAYERADEFYITYGNDRMIHRKCGKYELITKEKVLSIVEKDKKSYEGTYGKFTDQIRQLIKKEGKLNYFNIYPTTYGIGVWVFYNWHLEDDLKYMDDLMKSMGLEYNNEYSRAKWVFRYKISKKRDNLQKLENYVQGIR